MSSDNEGITISIEEPFTTDQCKLTFLNILKIIFFIFLK
jgi:hypothetical protein